MFVCEKCKAISLPREKMNKRTVLTVPRNYYNVVVLDPNTKRKQYFQYRERDVQILLDFKNDGFIILKDFITKGNEIKNEINLCKKCNQGG